MRYRFATLAALLLLQAHAAAHAAGLQISQFAYRSPDLLVFVNRGGAPPPLKGAAERSARAALGDKTLEVKSVEAWRPEAGVAVVVALDVSGSMKSVNFPAIQQAVAGLLDALPPRSSAALLTIGAGVQVQVPFGPVAAVKAALDGLTADAPETALNEGVLQAQDLAGMRPGGGARPGAELPLRRFVVLVTDGVDESKKAIGSTDMLSRVERGDVPLFIVAVTGTPAPRRRPVDLRPTTGLEPLANVARVSGGSFVQTTPQRLGDDLDALLREAMRAELVTIDCTPCVRDGSVRILQVSLPSGGSIVSDTRDVRLYAEPVARPPPPPPPPSSSPSPPPPPESGWLKKLIATIKVNVEVVLPWKAFLGLLSLLLPALAAGGYVYRRPIRGFILHVLHITPGPSTSTTNGPTDDKTSKTPAVPAATVDLTIDVEDVGRQHVRVTTADTVLGRSAKADVPVEKDREASNRHAALYVENNILMLRDLSSSNGTYLNGTRIVRPEPIHDRDVVRIGRTDLRIYLGRL